MAVENQQPIDKFIYYTPTPQQQFGGMNLETPRYPDKPRYFTSLLQKCLAPLQNNREQPDRTIRVDSRIQIFNNGDRPYPVTDRVRRTEFMEEAATIVGQACQDLLQPNGDLIPGQEESWFNLIVIAPRLITIMTDRDNYITMVQQTQALNTVATALHLARNPDTETVFSTGFGGSDDDFTSARFPAYGIPALRIVEQIHTFYNDRIANKLSGPNLSPEEYESILKRYAIPKKLPTIDFFLGHQAAIAINHTMDKDKVRIRAKENMAVLKDYVETYHPRIASRVAYLEDTPWDELKPHTKIVLEYLAQLLRISNDPTIQKTLATIQNFGKTHGGEIGSEQAAKYAAMHPWGFRDRLNLPFTKYLIGARNPTVNITIGGKPERHFCVVRTYLSQHANPEGLLEFIRTKLEQTTDTSERNSLMKTFYETERWKNKVELARQSHYFPNIEISPWDNQSVIRPDRPLYTISLITSIGEFPTYYTTEFDKPFGINPDEYGVFLQQKTQNFVNHPPTSQEGALIRSALDSVKFDMDAIRKDQKAV